MYGLQLVQHVVYLLAIVDIMEAVEPSELHNIVIVGIVGVKDDCVLERKRGGGGVRRRECVIVCG